MTHHITGNPPIRLEADFSAKTSQARREWDDVFKVLEKKKSTKNILFSKASEMKEIKSFPDKS